tara:strand:- start:1 stop:201 length:201 start_codon:yes stop_codon:yes gene_type:complete
MRKILDLHGIRHAEVDRLVENFILLNEPPLTIITGNSQRMMEIVVNCLVTHDVNFERWGSGVIKVL